MTEGDLLVRTPGDRLDLGGPRRSGAPQRSILVCVPWLPTVCRTDGALAQSDVDDLYSDGLGVSLVTIIKSHTPWRFPYNQRRGDS